MGKWVDLATMIPAADFLIHDAAYSGRRQLRRKRCASISRFQPPAAPGGAGALILHSVTALAAAGGDYCGDNGELVFPVGAKLPPPVAIYDTTLEASEVSLLSLLSEPQNATLADATAQAFNSHRWRWRRRPR